MTIALPPRVMPGMEPTDDELVRRVCAGDVAAYTPLVDRHYPRYLRFALRMLGTRQDAEEAVQDAFVRAYRGLAQYQERQRFEAWMSRIVVNCCRTLGAKRRRDASTFVPYDAADYEAGSNDGLDPVGRMEVQRALQTLPKASREALLLKFVDGWNYEEMAEITGASVSALKMRVMRAREQLRAVLAEGDHDGRA